MRLLLAGSIIFAISIVGWSAYHMYSSNQHIEELTEAVNSTDTAVVSYVPDSYSVTTSGTSSGSDRGSDIEENTSEFTEETTHEPVEETTPESAEETAFESAEEACCSDDEAKAASLEELRQKWTREYGDIPEIDTFITLARKMGNRELMTLEEDRTFLKLMAFFHPVEANIKAYETFERLFSDATSDTYSSSYTGPPPPNK